MEPSEPSDPAPLDPGDVERRFAEMLEEAGLPGFESTFHDPEIGMLELTWDHGLTFHFDLTRGGPIEPLDEADRRAILGMPLGSGWDEPEHVTVPGSPQGAENRSLAGDPPRPGARSAPFPTNRDLGRDDR